MRPMDRPDLYVVARILDALWRSDEPMLRTHVQVAANVNYDIFTRYLEWMRGKGLLAVDSSPDERARVSLTPEGREAYRKIVQWINEVVHGRLPGL